MTTRFRAEALDSAHCRDVMEPSGETIGLDSTCAQALQVMSASRRRFVPVADDGKLQGLITIGDFARLHGRNPERMFIGAIMTPARDLLTVPPETMAADAFRRLEESGYHQLPVVSAE